jgi:TRAP-type uncharacterized transport system substrate-binding protein
LDKARGAAHAAERAIAGRTAVLTSQNLLREAVQSGWSNKRQMGAYALLTIVVAIAGVFLARFLIAPKTLVFATGPKGTVEYAFAERLEAATAQNRRLRVVASPQDSPSAASSLFSQGKADLAIVRGDTKIPSRARAVAILDHYLLLVGVPKSAKPKSMAALKGKRLAMIGEDPRDAALVHDVLAFYDIAPATPLEQRNPQEWPRLFDPGNPAAIFYVVRKSEISTEKFLPNRSQKPNFELMELDGSKALAARLRGVTDDTIDAGMIVPSPKIPSEDLETIGIEDTLICQSKLSDANATLLADAIFENKDQLGEAGRYAVAIEPPDTDKDATILAHPGAAEYVGDETKTFFDRYSDMIYIGMSIASVVGSIFLGLYSTVTRISPVRAGQLSDAVLSIGDRACDAADYEEIAALEKELNQLLAEVLAGVRDGKIASEGFEAFRLAFDVAREALGVRKDMLARGPIAPATAQTKPTSA